MKKYDFTGCCAQDINTRKMFRDINCEIDLHSDKECFVLVIHNHKCDDHGEIVMEDDEIYIFRSMMKCMDYISRCFESDMNYDIYICNLTYNYHMVEHHPDMATEVHSNKYGFNLFNDEEKEIINHLIKINSRVYIME